MTAISVTSREPWSGSAVVRRRTGVAAGGRPPSAAGSAVLTRVPRSDGRDSERGVVETAEVGTQPR